jgi:hypothetical protein
MILSTKDWLDMQYRNLYHTPVGTATTNCVCHLIESGIGLGSIQIHFPAKTKVTVAAWADQDYLT